MQRWLIGEDLQAADALGVWEDQKGYLGKRILD